jgi:hypothetical protein
MTINPHPYVLTVAAELRHGEVLALVARERRARQAAVPSRPAHPGTDRRGPVPVARVLARLLADTRRAAFPLRSMRMSCS